MSDGFCPNCAHPVCDVCSVCPMCGHGVECLPPSDDAIIKELRRATTRAMADDLTPARRLLILLADLETVLNTTKGASHAE